MSEKPRAYSYLRFSSPEQAKGDSMRRQTVLADDYAKRHGLVLDTELNLRDLGVSAFRGDNATVGALGAFRQAIRDGLVPQGSLLLVEALDRLSRELVFDAVMVLGEILRAGVLVVTLNDQKTYTKASLGGTDFLMAVVLLMRGNEESDTKSKRLVASWVGKRERALKGQILTTRVPAWIKAEGSAAKNAHNAKLSLIPERAALVRRMFEMFLAGAGKSGIAERFNAERVPTWGAGKGRKAAAHWHKTYVFKILTSPTVTGRFTPHIEDHSDGRMVRVPQSPIEGYYPRVVDDETFQRAQTLIGARRTTVRSSTVASIVAGLAKCPKCGSTMTRVMKGAKGGAPKLVCTKAKAGGGCKYQTVKLPDVERALIENAAHLAEPPLADEDLATEIKGAEAELFHLTEAIESLVDSIERSPSEALTKRLAEREAERGAVRAGLKQLETRAADSASRVVNHRAARLSSALKLLKTKPGTMPAANAALRECVTSVVVDYESGALTLNWRHGKTSELPFAWPEEVSP